MTTAQTEWVPGTVHPTGGYDRIEKSTRDGGPLAYYYGADLHRLDGPAVVSDFAEEWWFEGERHRDGGPSYSYRADGKTFREVYHRHGVVSREDGPARLHFSRTTGLPVVEEWVLDGERHRLDGPAVTNFGEHGEITEEHFYLFGTPCSPKEFTLLRDALDSGAPLDWAVAFARGQVS